MSDTPANAEPFVVAQTCTEASLVATLPHKFDPTSSPSDAVPPSLESADPFSPEPTVYLPTSDSGWFSSGWTNDGTDGSDVPPNITCIDCGGRCHLLTIVTEEQPLLPGDVATYRCEDCRDRWDLIVPGGEDEDGYDQFGDRTDGYPEGW
jgi:hypothetical protein